MIRGSSSRGPSQVMVSPSAPAGPRGGGRAQSHHCSPADALSRARASVSCVMWSAVSECLVCVLHSGEAGQRGCKNEGAPRDGQASNGGGDPSRALSVLLMRAPSTDCKLPLDFSPSGEARARSPGLACPVSAPHQSCVPRAGTSPLPPRAVCGLAEAASLSWGTLVGALGAPDPEQSSGGLPGREGCFLFHTSWAVAQHGAIISSASEFQQREACSPGPVAGAGCPGSSGNFSSPARLWPQGFFPGGF